MNNIEHALNIAYLYGATDETDHKTWVIDQMVRALTGCQTKERVCIDSRGNPYTAKVLVPNESYEAFVREFNQGDEGPDTYAWETGIAP